MLPISSFWEKFIFYKAFYVKPKLKDSNKWLRFNGTCQLQKFHKLALLKRIARKIQLPLIIERLEQSFRCGPQVIESRTQRKIRWLCNILFIFCDSNPDCLVKWRSTQPYTVLEASQFSFWVLKIIFWVKFVNLVFTQSKSHVAFVWWDIKAFHATIGRHERKNGYEYIWRMHHDFPSTNALLSKNRTGTRAHVLMCMGGV